MATAKERQRQKSNQKKWAEKLYQAQRDPRYDTIYNIIGDAADFDTARAAINKFGRENFKEHAGEFIPELVGFLRNNERFFFDKEKGTRIPYDKDAVYARHNAEMKAVEEKARKLREQDARKEAQKKAQNAANDTANNAAKEGAKQVRQETAQKTGKEAAEEAAKKLSPNAKKKIINGRSLNAAFNLVTSVGMYKDAREEGKGVIGSVAKAGTSFAVGELLGMAALPIMALKAAPGAVIGGIEKMQSVTRQMNNIQRVQTFGDAYFQDTQQLATMRQSGMELAKMSQYNLQQAIMGNEAQYMHKL